MPSCVGHYAVGDLECNGADGVSMCAWRPLCAKYKQVCQMRRVDPEVEKEVLGPAGLVHVLQGVTLAQAPRDKELMQAQSMRSWPRLLQAFRDAMPNLIVSPSQPAALLGELYESHWMHKDGVAIRCKLLCVKVNLAGSLDFALLRFWPARARKSLPIIEMRTDVLQFLQHYPAMEKRAWRWSDVGHGGRLAYMGCAAYAVELAHVADFGRLLAAELRAGRIRGVTVAPDETHLYAERPQRGRKRRSA